MASQVPGYEYDIFISYRQKDNKYDGWVTEFVDNLKRELEATFKEEVSVYFDINPHDGLLETHDVDESLKEKLKCLVLIPVISRTYCDPKSFAWENEFKAFIDHASLDQFGLKVKIANGNVASRVIPVRIYDLEPKDIILCESVLQGVLRGVEFVYAEPGVNRPLSPDDDEKNNLYKTKYRNQINKVGNAIKDVITAIEQFTSEHDEVSLEVTKPISVHSKKNKATLISGSVIFMLIISGLLFIPKIFVNKEEFEKSIAVIPFYNLSGDPNQEYMSDGLTDEIISQLFKIESFDKVISLGSVLTYKGTDKRIPQIAEELNVNYILEGTFRKTGEQMRIKVELIEPKNDKHIWQNEYEQPSSEISTIQIDIAIQIATELKTKLSPKEIKQIRKKPTENLRAHDFYLLGRYYWNKRTKEGLQHSIEYFGQANKLDQNYALAYAGLADAYYVSGDWLYISPDTAFQKAREYAQKAISLDNTIAEAYTTLAGLTRNYKEAESLYLTSLKLNPNYANAHHWYAVFLCEMGRLDEAIFQINQALKLDPSSAIINLRCAIIYYYREDYDKAILQMKEALKLDSEIKSTIKNQMFLCYFQKGLMIEAINEYKEVITDDSSMVAFNNNAITIYESSGTNALLNFIIDLELPNPNKPPWDLAILYSLSGNKQKALDNLESMFNANINYAGLKVEPAFKSLRSDVRFIALLQKLGLEE